MHFGFVRVLIILTSIGATIGCQPSQETKTVDQSELEAYVAENPELTDIEMTP